MPTSQPGPRILSFDDFDLDTHAGELRKRGVRLRLRGQPLQVLAVLLNRAGDVVTREELRSQIWTADTFVDFDHSLHNAIARLREVLGDSAETPRYIETLPRRGYRFIGLMDGVDGQSPPRAFTQSEQPAEAPVDRRLTRSYQPADIRTDLQRLKRDTESGKPGVSGAAAAQVVAGRKKRRWAFASTAILFIAVAVGALLLHGRKAHALTDKDTIILADFTNTTGDAVFDDTLRQGLSVQLEQSPFLSIVPDLQIQQTLQMMDQKPDAKLTPEIALELCQRTGSAAVLNGSIAQIGTPYLVTVKAVNCTSGQTMASAETQASDKNHVLDALGKTASEIRNKLGESLSTVQKFDTPIEQATTSSLEALKAYSLGWKSVTATGDAGASDPVFKRAVSLDPHFAMAYALLGISYAYLGENALAAENMRRAYELRNGVSERERFFIESHYEYFVTGNLEKARQSYEFWAQTYPRDWPPRNELSDLYEEVGQYDKSLAESREAHRLYPSNGLIYGTLIASYLQLNRLDEARATSQEAQDKQLDSTALHFIQYQLAFLREDMAGMAQQVAWAAGKPGIEDVLLEYEADTAAYFGRLRKARELSHRAVFSAEQAEEKETAACYEAYTALREAVLGNEQEARQDVASALRLSTGREVQNIAALTLALAGDAGRAQDLADDLSRRFPENTIFRFNYLPTVQAQLALSRNNAPKAIEILQSTATYELGSVGTALYPIYVRGEAYIAVHHSYEAVSEFQKILDHRGIVVNQPIGALAHLQLGRAYALQGDTAKARAAYQDFLTLWKDADPDIPILKQAKAEYSELQ
jgi:DNA-binding winged helix-turn-helix (wHTH) protein/Flp pilus assembly protein TadD